MWDMALEDDDKESKRGEGEERESKDEKKKGTERFIVGMIVMRKNSNSGASNVADGFDSKIGVYYSNRFAWIKLDQGTSINRIQRPLFGQQEAHV